ncbi:hypothetical protein SAMN04488103_101408 [Gemmobacter aquatilis]|uniref:Uncharacterized protein n=1 Tax=Gemmobacter aquatilis TaxID=933059 RepID=A0A1H7Z696_9RHOB|nr:hypothetical protein [Gemmobacter aquatilis]SEM53534.1 hypothetical protein SAMN04488103_101408 [Gemmobacter aquatilis]
MTDDEWHGHKQKSALAERKANSARDQEEPMGFAGLGDFHPDGTDKVYVRKRLRPTPDPFVAVAQEVERMLGPLVGKGGGKLPSVGGFARAGLSRLETVRELMRSLPPEKQAEISRLVTAAWQGGQNQTIALLRDQGFLNAKRGLDVAIRMKSNRLKSKAHAELLHPEDKRHFPMMKEVIEAAEKSGNKLSERDAAKRVLYPNLPHIPDNAAGAKKKREIDSLRNRYRRWKKNLGR